MKTLGLIRRLKKLKEDLSGNVLVMVAAGTAGMIGSAGIAVDAVQWYLWKREMQQAVDAASMAGALSLWRGDDWEEGAKLALSRAANETYDIETLVNPPDSGDWAGDNLAVEVIVTTSRALPFSSVFMAEPATIRVRSVATAIGEGEHCVISLKKTGVGVSTKGGANVDLGCGVAANSKASDAVFLNGTSKLSASPINAVGGITYGSSNIDSDTLLLPYGNEVSDPIAERNLEVPTAPCDYNNASVLPSATATYTPSSDADGIIKFCGGLDIKGTVHLDPGVYIIYNGDLKVNSGAKITGSDVTIILGGQNQAKMADVDISGTATVDLAATDDDSSDWDGILFFQDPLGSSHVSTINGGSNLGLEGIVYMPGGDVEFNGSSGQHADCLLLVASTVTFGGESSLDYDSSKCPFDTDSIDNAARIIRVVE